MFEIKRSPHASLLLSTFSAGAALALLLAPSVALAKKGDGGGSGGGGGTPSPTPAHATETDALRAADGGFAGWTLDGVSPDTSGALVLDPANATSQVDPYAAGTYSGGNYYDGGTHLVGTATGPVTSTSFEFEEAIASWNADTPAGTWVEVLVRFERGGALSKWYTLGIWADDDGTVQRHSVRSQGDTDGYVATDTLVVYADKKAFATGYQLQARLFSQSGSDVPAIDAMALTYSEGAPRSATLLPGDPDLWGTTLDVPTCSQMIYPDGGNVWCSPTSVSMVMGYYGHMVGACEPRVRDAVDHTYDWIYGGWGNWPFNTAYAATWGHEARVERHGSMLDLEAIVAAGIPPVISLAWSKGELSNASIESSPGHLMVVVGFDANGDVVVNDPAAPSDATVRRTYLRTELETLWLETSGGTTYVIEP